MMMWGMIGIGLECVKGNIYPQINDQDCVRVIPLCDFNPTAAACIEKQKRRNSCHSKRIIIVKKKGG